MYAPDSTEVLDRLRSYANADNVAGMTRFGIASAGTLGVSMPLMRGIAKDLRPARKADPAYAHRLAGELWGSGVHEARILAALVDVPALVTPEQADAWVADLDSWDVCDQLCGNLLDKVPFAYEKAEQWAADPREFVRRAGFVLMTQLAVHDKKAPDAPFLHFLEIVEAGGDDDRNFVKKAVNWALRQIGKRNGDLHGSAVVVARRMRESTSKAARWIAADALRELMSEQVLARFDH